MTKIYLIKYITLARRNVKQKLGETLFPNYSNTNLIPTALLSLKRPSHYISLHGFRLSLFNNTRNKGNDCLYK